MRRCTRNLGASWRGLYLTASSYCLCVCPSLRSLEEFFLASRFPAAHLSILTTCSPGFPPARGRFSLGSLAVESRQDLLDWCDGWRVLGWELPSPFWPSRIHTPSSSRFPSRSAKLQETLLVFIVPFVATRESTNGSFSVTSGVGFMQVGKSFSRGHVVQVARDAPGWKEGRKGERNVRLPDSTVVPWAACWAGSCRVFLVALAVRAGTGTGLGPERLA